MNNSPIRYWYLAAVVGISVLTSTFAAASLILTTKQPVKHLTSSEINDIREAVFRYQFRNNASAQQQKANAYFLSLEEGIDPSNRFMKRFKDHQPPVKKASQAKGEWGVIDKETGLEGLRFRIESIKQISPNRVKVDGGYYEGNMSASGNTYTVRRIKNKWIVTQDKMRWIS